MLSNIDLEKLFILPTYINNFKSHQIVIGTFMVIDPMVNRAHHGGACSSSSLNDKIKHIT